MINIKSRILVFVIMLTPWWYLQLIELHQLHKCYRVKSSYQKVILFVDS